MSKHAKKSAVEATPPRSAARGRSTFVALLRGINVGGKNKLAMHDLASAMTALGCGDVRTYIQSGNAVFTATAAVGKRLPAGLQVHLADHFGLHAPIVLRRADELRRMAADNPFVRAGAAPESLFVGFLAKPPSKAQVAALDPARSPGDEFTVVGRDVYLRLGNGAADTKLTNAWFDRQLDTTITVRNWRTVQRLLAMVDGDGSPR